VNYIHAVNNMMLQFQQHLRLNKNQSQATINGYMQGVREFADFLFQYYEGSLVNWGQINKAVAQLYITECTKQNKAPRSINLRITSLRIFVDFLVLRQETKENPFYFVRHFLPATSTPLALTDADLNNLLCAPSCCNTVNTDNLPEKAFDWDFLEYATIRDEAIVCLLAFTGLKTGEILNVCPEDFDLCTSMLVVRGKDHSRTLFIDESVGSSLKEVIKLRLALFPDSDQLFLNRQGGSLTARSIERLIKKYAIQAGITPDLSPRLLRRAFERRLIIAGINDWLIQYLLGHNHASTTQALITEIKDALKKATPKLKTRPKKKEIYDRHD